MVGVTRDGREEVLEAEPAAYESPRLSPDDRYVAVEVRSPTNADVVVYDLARNTPTFLTLNQATDAYPIWTLDGRRVLFSSTRHGQMNIFSKAADGTGPAVPVMTSASIQWPQSITPDGGTLVFGDNPDGQFDIHVITLGEGTRTESLIKTRFGEANSRVAPDGKWIAYASNQTGQCEVYVRPFPDTQEGRRTTISRNGGWAPTWSRDGDELFFRRTGSWEMMGVAVATEPTFSAGNPEPLFEAPSYLFMDPAGGRTPPWDVAKDGRFLMVKEEASLNGTAGTIVVAQNWAEELKRLFQDN